MLKYVCGMGVLLVSSVVVSSVATFSARAFAMQRPYGDSVSVTGTEADSRNVESHSAESATANSAAKTASGIVELRIQKNLIEIAGLATHYSGSKLAPAELKQLDSLKARQKALMTVSAVVRGQHLKSSESVLEVVKRVKVDLAETQVEARTELGELETSLTASAR